MIFFRKRQRERTRRTKQQWKQRGKQAFRIALMLALLGVLTVLFPTQQQYEYSAFREGAIAPDEVIALNPSLCIKARKNTRVKSQKFATRFCRSCAMIARFSKTN